MRGWILPSLFVLFLAQGVCALATGEAAQQLAAPPPEVSDCPPMPVPITVGGAVDVFVGGTGPNPVNRIPTITKAGNRVLAFAEGRAALNDIGTNDLVLVTSDDGGATWSKLTPIESLPDPCCQAGLRSVAVGSRSVLAFTGCDSTAARTNGTLWISLDDGASWALKQSLAPGFFAYSAPVDLGGDRIGVLAEIDDYRRIRFIPVELRIPALR